MPTKDPKYEALLNELTEAAFGRNRSSCIGTHTCVMCGKKALAFRDELSYKEFRISAICQDCQDQVFPPPQENLNGSSD